jgi:hypothetical protein
MLWRWTARKPMNLLTDVFWIAGPLLQLTLLTFLWKRKLRAIFPRFFAYIAFQVVKAAVLFAVYHYAPESYYYAYWTGNLLSVLLAVTVMDEVWRNLFRPYAGLQMLGSVIFRWACAVMLLIAVSSAVSGAATTSDRVQDTILNFDRSMRLMQCGLFLLLVLLSRLLKHFWRQHVFGIALGFGIFASVEFLLVSMLLRFGDAHIEAMSSIKSAAYLGVLLLWIGYIRQRRPIAVASRQLIQWNLAFTGPLDSAQLPSFITMVEQAAERVLARSAWTRSPGKGLRVVGGDSGSDKND